VFFAVELNDDKTSKKLNGKYLMLRLTSLTGMVDTPISIAINQHALYEVRT
jgi:hypothetical protein